jgi:hypothetical protein
MLEYPPAMLCDKYVPLSTENYFFATHPCITGFKRDAKRGRLKLDRHLEEEQGALFQQKDA